MTVFGWDVDGFWNTSCKYFRLWISIHPTGQGYYKPWFVITSDPVLVRKAKDLAGIKIGKVFIGWIR